MSVRIADASAIAALVFKEPDFERVAARLAGAELAAPTLLRYEIANVCVKKLKASPHLREGLLAGMASFASLVVDEVDVPVDAVVGLAERHRLSAYDAAYLWLARELDAELVTLDDKLAKAARREHPKT